MINNLKVYVNARDPFYSGIWIFEEMRFLICDGLMVCCRQGRRFLWFSIRKISFVNKNMEE